MKLGVDPTGSGCPSTPRRKAPRRGRKNSARRSSGIPTRAWCGPTCSGTQRRSDEYTSMKWKPFDGTAVELYQVKTGTYVWGARAQAADQAPCRRPRGEYLDTRPLRRPEP
jgi:hypothetical protein